MIEEVSARQALDPGPALEFIRLHRSVLSTFRRLPDEIIGDVICGHYSESSLVMDSYVGFWQRVVHPVAPSQVCQSWRSISLSLPHLWAHISIEASVWKPSLSQPTEFFLRYLDAVIHRSGEAPFRSLFVMALEHLSNKISMPLWIFLRRIPPDGGHCALSLPGHF